MTTIAAFAMKWFHSNA